ncbi:hypothetical protein [Novosphingobium soli]|uniref:Uncharacterized protein n=1 Tax=Novosphingobium soli TaxID=574956 RepID=A0ABV6CXS7_9SPHN
MDNNSYARSPHSLTAIAAVLALSSVPAMAQEVQPPAPAAPAPVIDAAPPATPITPTLVLPPAATAPTAAPDATTTAGTTPSAAAPVVVPEPAPAAGEGARSQTVPAQVTSRTASTPPTRTRLAQPVAVEASDAQPTVPTARQNGTAADGALAQGGVPRAVASPAGDSTAPAPAARAPARAEDADRGRKLPLAEIAGILAALGIAGVGIAAMMRRRRSPVAGDLDDAPEPLPPMSAAEPVPAPARAVAAAQPGVAEPAVVEPPVRAAAPVGAGATAMLAASPLPRTAQERQSILDRMVAATPDEGNPFTSRKGRLRRARIQLQHREHREQAAAERASSFDFRTYRSSKQPGTETASSPARPDLVDA